MKYVVLVACVILVGCGETMPTSPTAISTAPPSAPRVSDGAFVGVINSDLRAELTYRADGRSTFRVINPAQNRLCLEAGTSVTPPIVFTATPGTLGCYVRDRVANVEDYLRLCFTSPDRVEGTFWLSPSSRQPLCIHGPEPPPTSPNPLVRPEGGSFAFVMTRQ